MDTMRGRREGCGDCNRGSESIGKSVGTAGRENTGDSLKCVLARARLDGVAHFGVLCWIIEPFLGANRFEAEGEKMDGKRELLALCNGPRHVISGR